VEDGKTEIKYLPYQFYMYILLHPPK